MTTVPLNLHGPAEHEAAAKALTDMANWIINHNASAPQIMLELGRRVGLIHRHAEELRAQQPKQPKEQP